MRNNVFSFDFVDDDRMRVRLKNGVRFMCVSA